MKFLALKSLLKRLNPPQFRSDAPARNALQSNAGEMKTIADQKRAVLVKQGRDQFKQLLEKGLRVPVALL